MLLQTAAAPASAAKKELVAKVLKLQQTGVDIVARQLIEQPAAQMMQQAGIALQQRVAADRREAVGIDIKAERVAQERLAQQVRQLESEKQALQADLGFFERLLPVAGDGLQLRGLQAEPKAPGQVRYQMMLFIWV